MQENGRSSDLSRTIAPSRRQCVSDFYAMTFARRLRTSSDGNYSSGYCRGITPRSLARLGATAGMAYHFDDKINTFF